MAPFNSFRESQGSQQFSQILKPDVGVSVTCQDPLQRLLGHSIQYAKLFRRKRHERLGLSLGTRNPSSLGTMHKNPVDLVKSPEPIKPVGSGIRATSESRFEHCAKPPPENHPERRIQEAEALSQRKRRRPGSSKDSHRTFSFAPPKSYQPTILPIRQLPLN
jgi:hypothetical protein